MLIEARGLRKVYCGKEVLHGIDLQLEKRGILAIIGPNGAGKSTLLRLLNLIEEPTSGKIIFEGEDISSLDCLLAVRRRMGAVLQNPVLFEGTVDYNVGYGLRVRGVHGEKKVSDALGKVGLGGFDERQVRGLSGGECQRVALARAIAFTPDLLLLDEPTANIDNRNAALVEKTIVQVGKKAAVVLSTHNLFQAKRIADATVFMESGKIIERNATRELFSGPEDARTRRFISGSSVF